MSPVTVVMTLMTAFVLLAPIAMAVVLVSGGLRRPTAAPALAIVPAPAAEAEVGLSRAA